MYAEKGLDNAQCAQRQPEVAEWLETLSHAIKETDETVRALVVRLAPVSREDAVLNKAGEKAPEAGLVPVANSLRNACEQIRSIGFMAHEAISRLEV